MIFRTHRMADLFSLSFLVSLSFLINGCATTAPSKNSSTTIENSQSSTIVEGNQAAAASPSNNGSLPSVPSRTPKSPWYREYPDLEVAGVKIQNNGFDFPVTVNERVTQWVEYFTGRGRKHFEKYLERSEMFIPYIEPILIQSGLPTDLVYLAMIESGFNNHARSWARAVGAWQFMPATGRRFGLTVNWWLDERRDVEKSTRAAAQFLKELYGIFENWELASAGYNAGEVKILRAIRKYRSNNFWEIAQKKNKYLKPETQNYVPKIIAAAIVAKNRTQFGFPERYEIHANEAEPLPPLPDEPIRSDEVAEVIQKKLEKTPGVDDRRIVQGETDGESNGEDDEDEVPAAQAMADEEDDSAVAPVPYVDKTGQLVNYQQLASFEIQSPADLQKIADAAGLSYTEVRALNPEVVRWMTPPNLKSFRIRLPVSVKERFLQAYNHPSFPRSPSLLTHVVKKGETVKSIAARYKIKEDPLLDLNRLSRGQPLRAGFEVVLPMPTDRSRTYAELELYDPPAKKKRRSRRGRKVAKRDKRALYQVSLKERAVARGGSGKAVDSSR